MAGQWDYFTGQVKPSIEYLELYAMTAGVLAWIHRFNKEANWLYAELLQIMCSEEKMSNKIYFTYIYFIVVPCDAVLVETWGCCPSFQLSQKVNPTL